jgi:pyrroline-5-carboxylate reductase
MQITFIGGGNMASALVGGLLGRGVPGTALNVVEPLHEARARIGEAFGVACFERVADVPALGEVVVFAVKPQQMRSAAHEVGPHLGAAIALSVAAGIRLADLRRWLGGTPMLARCMPNTPALIGLSATAAYAEPRASAAQRAAIQAILEAVGIVVWVEEEALLDPVTALSGSGPAYVFHFIEALEDAGVAMGLPRDTARALAIQTARGAGELAARSSDAPGVLRERVTSRGGTTERALASLAADDVRGAIARAAQAANERARALGDEFGRDP